MPRTILEMPEVEIIALVLRFCEDESAEVPMNIIAEDQAETVMPLLKRFRNAKHLEYPWLPCVWFLASRGRRYWNEDVTGTSSETA